MIGLGVANAVVNGGASAIGAQIITSLLMGNFNPDYKKEARKQMRYIQQKYSLAYGGGLSDPQSKLLMVPSGTKPANPFPDERAFEDSLQMNFHPVSGHQGRFVASHAMAAIGAIIDYQNIRRARTWIPGVISPGRPNDYINMFLEESKVWLRTQLTLDSVHAEELKRRADYYTKLKNDNYYWQGCFPVESETCNIHKVIDFVHEKVLSAYELVSREEKNKSLQTLFKELNDHTTNAFEFGKLFLSYLLFSQSKAGANIYSTREFDGKSYATGKLHRLLEQATDLVFKTYIDDMTQTQERLSAPLSSQQGQGQQSQILGQARSSNNSIQMITNGTAQLQLTNSAQSVAASVTGTGISTVAGGPGSQMTSPAGVQFCDYLIDVTDYAEASLVAGAVYIIEICDPKGYAWNVRHTYTEFESMHSKLAKELSLRGESIVTVDSATVYDPSVNTTTTTNNINSSSSKAESKAVKMALQEYLTLPQNVVPAMFRKKEQYELMCDLLKGYLIRLLTFIHEYSASAQAIIAAFLETKHLVVSPNRVLKHAETVPNVFLNLKQEFTSQLVNKSTASHREKSGSFSNNAPALSVGSFKDTQNAQSNMSKQMAEFRKAWGIEWILKILEAYSLLQRMATILGWTLEINHFFISMFGNTLAFSKLPLRDIIMTQKDILSKLLVVCTDLYDYACKLNTESQYKWHKNLQMTEHELSRLKHHIESAIAVIQSIDTEHLDYEAQMRRLQDVHSRFAPLMNRVDTSLVSIQNELNLPTHAGIIKHPLPVELHSNNTRHQPGQQIDNRSLLSASEGKQQDERQQHLTITNNNSNRSSQFSDSKNNDSRARDRDGGSKALDSDRRPLGGSSSNSGSHPQVEELPCSSDDDNEGRLCEEKQNPLLGGGRDCRTNGNDGAKSCGRGSESDAQHSSNPGDCDKTVLDRDVGVAEEYGCGGEVDGSKVCVIC